MRRRFSGLRENEALSQPSYTPSYGSKNLTAKIPTRRSTSGMVATLKLGLVRRTRLLDPPKLADFLISLIPIKHRENPAGDLEEDYWNRLIPRHGLRKARFLFWAQVAYALLGFLARPLAQIAGIGWIARLIEILVHKMMR